MLSWLFITRGRLGREPWWNPPVSASYNKHIVVVQAASTNLLLIVDILSPSVAASIATLVVSPLDARGFVPVGSTVLEGDILPPSFSLQLGTGVGSISLT